MGKRVREWLGLVKHSEYTRRYVEAGNLRSAVYMTVIVIALEIWMILSLARLVIESAAAGTPRDFMWVVNHGAWYVVLLGMALAVLLYALRPLRGKQTTPRDTTLLLLVFSVVCLVFGIHFGNNSYVHGEQVLAFVTMTLFVFGTIVWEPIPALVGSVLAFGGFYVLIDSGVPATYGTQVNLFTLWISTFVVSLSAYHQKISEAHKAHSTQLANERLQKLTSFDELTGIPSMHTFRNAVAVIYEGTDELEASYNIRTNYSILFLDIENFKSYNERYGFLAGDSLLRTFAQGLQEIFAGELVARFSDDHFVALCPTDVAQERADAGHSLLRTMRRDVRLRLKTGAFEPVDEKSLDVSLACDKARIACNSIKRHADLRFATYDKALDQKVELRTHVINTVKTAVKQGWIEVYYQPVVNCADGSGELCGYEALARWNDPQYGLLPPYAFIETLEEFREIDKLDRCIIEQVCRDLRAELDAGKPVVPVSLNFSRLDFELYDVPAFLNQMSAKYDVPANLLDVEITESALSEQFRELQRTMDTLRKDDYSLWLDDFGSGYSSLNVLKDFRFNVLKIDMAFLRGFPDNPKSGNILQHIVALANELGMVTLCEGVETLEQFDFLHSIGCDRAQGYYFGKPSPTKALPTPL